MEDLGDWLHTGDGLPTHRWSPVQVLTQQCATGCRFLGQKCDALTTALPSRPSVSLIFLLSGFRFFDGFCCFGLGLSVPQASSWLNRLLWADKDFFKETARKSRFGQGDGCVAAVSVAFSVTVFCLLDVNMSSLHFFNRAITDIYGKWHSVATAPELQAVVHIVLLFLALGAGPICHQHWDWGVSVYLPTFYRNSEGGAGVVEELFWWFDSTENATLWPINSHKN